MKPNFLSIAAQTWNHLRRFPTSDALADAVMMQAVWSLVLTPFRIAKFYSSTQDEFFAKWRRWNVLILPLGVFLNVFGLFWRFNLSLRLRRNEKKAWRVATFHAILTLLVCANSLFWMVLLRNGPRELSEEDRQQMTEEQIARHNAWLEKARQEPPKPMLTPKQIGFFAIAIGLALNVLARAFQEPTRSRFGSKMALERHTEAT